MEIDIFMLVAAFGGGAFGAAIGGQTAFIFTGIAYFIGLGGLLGGMDTSMFMNTVVFGPVFGPHIAFAGGATAAAYAAKRGYMRGANGRDIVTALSTFGNHPDIYIVGGITGMIGYIINQFLGWVLPTMSVSEENAYATADGAVNTVLGHTDTVALTIIIIAFATRAILGTKGRQIFGPYPYGAMGTGEGAHWVEHQEKWGITATYGFVTGLLSAFATLVLMIQIFPHTPAIAGWAQLVGWAISAVTLVFLSLGMATPVTHHMTIIGSIAALKMAPIVTGTANPLEWADAGGSMVILLIIGGIFGLISAVVGEVLSRLTQINGDTHIDPPAFAIFVMTTVIYAITALVG